MGKIKTILIMALSSLSGSLTFFISEEKKRYKKEVLEWGGRPKNEVIKIVTNSFLDWYEEKLTRAVLTSQDEWAVNWRKDSKAKFDEEPKGNKDLDTYIKNGIKWMVQNGCARVFINDGAPIDANRSEEYYYIFNKLSELGVKDFRQKIKDVFSNIYFYNGQNSYCSTFEN